MVNGRGVKLNEDATDVRVDVRVEFPSKPTATLNILKGPWAPSQTDK